METKTLIARIALIIACGAVAVTCLYNIVDTVDPFARYTPNLSEKQKEVILEYLDEEDIAYMVESQIEPNEFMNFIKVEGFTIRNAKLYTTALQTQKTIKKDIVNFVNKYRSHFNRTSLKNLLTYYTYTDLVNFYETEQVLNTNLRLVDNPENPYLILNKNKSIYKYAPKKLVEFKNMKVRSQIVDDLTALVNAMESTLDHKMKFLNGYNSYESLVDDFRIVEESSPYVHHIQNAAGSNEEQLGYTVIFKGQDDWLASCIEHLKPNEKVDYDATFEALSDEIQDEISWIEDNAYHYGFVIRYAKENEEQSELWYQPFLLRYVGKKTAKKMHDENTYMENTTFSKTLK